MEILSTLYPLHACQHCGSESKLVETLIDDEFIWNEYTCQYEPLKFMDDFEHTGNDRCSNCLEPWTGA
jgi:hypothetical protein